MPIHMGLQPHNSLVCDFVTRLFRMGGRFSDPQVCSCPRGSCVTCNEGDGFSPDFPMACWHYVGSRRHTRHCQHVSWKQAQGGHQAGVQGGEEIRHHQRRPPLEWPREDGQLAGWVLLLPQRARVRGRHLVQQTPARQHNSCPRRTALLCVGGMDWLPQRWLQPGRRPRRWSRDNGSLVGRGQ